LDRERLVKLLEELPEETKRALLEKALQLGLDWRSLGVSKSHLHRVLRGERPVSTYVLNRIAELLGEREVLKLVGAAMNVEGRARLAGLLREDGSIDYEVLLALLRYVIARDAYARQLIVSLVAEELGDELETELRKRTAPVLRWCSEFERWLTQLKPRTRVASRDTLEYYRNLFLQHLEGRRLTEELVRSVAESGHRWLITVLRHYVQFLAFRREISSGEAWRFLTMLRATRGGSGPRIVRSPRVEEVRRTLEFLAERHGLYHALYRLMLYSGARLEHAVEVLATWSPDDEIEIGDSFTPRLVCFDEQGFCRYYAGIHRGRKRTEWLWIPLDVVEELRQWVGTRIDRRYVTRYAEKHGLVMPKLLRKLNFRACRDAGVEKEVCNFMQSRFYKLDVGDVHYDNLLRRVDRSYPRIMETLQRYDPAASGAQERAQRV